MLNKTLFTAFFAAGTMIAAGSASAASVTVVNHSFEDDAAPTNTNVVGQNNITPTGWDGFGARFVFHPEHPDATAWNGLDVLSIPGQGNNVAGTQSGSQPGGSGLYQTLSETYVEGVEYTFTLWVGGSYESPGGTQTIGFTTGATNLSGSLLASNSVAFPAAGNNWVQNSVSYTATALDAGQNIRIILGTTDANGTQSFDLAEVDAVPEPSSLALLGLGGLAMMRRRRN